jgi:CDP-glycerol glycerophosphotransferase (TagB/SpsB family)
MLRRLFESRGVHIVLMRLFKLVDYLWPKQRNLVVFSGGRHTSFSDNSRYLFEKFLWKYTNEFEIVWVTPDRNMLKDHTIEKGVRDRMIYMYSLEGFVTLLRARVIFFSWAFSDLPGTAYSRRTLTVQLWHGIPIKRICNVSRRANEKDGTSAIQQWNKFSYWISSSPVDRNSVALCTGTPLDKVRVTGYPRNDYLIEHSNPPDPKLTSRFPFLDSRLVILYAPTWRASYATKFFPFEDFEFQELKEFLERNDACLILRAHHADDILVRNGTIDYESLKHDRIFVLNRDLVRDIQDVLPHVDILISDYSGIWVDFLLLDRPLVFVPYDLDEYEANEGLLYDYELITPGPKASDFKDLLRALEDYIKNPSKDSAERKNVKKLFHKFEDGKAYERIYGLVKEEIAVTNDASEIKR